MPGLQVTAGSPSTAATPYPSPAPASNLVPASAKPLQPTQQPAWLKAALKRPETNVSQLGDAQFRLPVHNVIVNRSASESNSLPPRRASSSSDTLPQRRPRTPQLPPPKIKTRPKTPQLPVQNFPEYKLYPGFKDAASGIHESGSLARLLTRPQSASSLQYSPRVQPESAAALPPPSSSHFVEEMDQLLIETEEALAAVPAADALVERPWLNEAPAPAPVEAPAPATSGGGSRVTFQTDAVAAPAPAEVVNTTTYGWQTKIRSPQGKPMHVVLSQGGKPLEPSEVAEFSPDLVTLHGRAHFYLQTGVLPESLIPRSSGPVKPVSMTSAAIARRKKAEAERQKKKEAERQLVESIMRRARRETANNPLKERPGSAGGDSSSMAHREWPGARLERQATNRALYIVPEPPPGPTSLDLLHDTLGYVQRRSFDHQVVMDEKARDDHSAAAERAASKARCASWLASTSAPAADVLVLDGSGADGGGRHLQLPTLTSEPYLYPSGGGGHLAGAEFVAHTQIPPAPAPAASKRASREEILTPAPSRPLSAGPPPTPPSPRPPPAPPPPTRPESRVISRSGTMQLGFAPATESVAE